LAKSKGGAQPTKKGADSERNNGKAPKKRPQIFDPIKRRLMNK